MKHERSFQPAVSVPDCGEAEIPRRGRISRWLRAYWQRQARLATEAWLHSLDDRTLKDIGLTRTEIPSAVYGGGRCHPRYDDGWRHVRYL